MDKEIIVLANSTDWCELCLSDLVRENKGRVINTKYPCKKNSFMYYANKLHHSERINNIVKLPFKKSWFHYYAKTINPNKEQELILVIYDRNELANNEAFLKYIRKYYKKINLVYIFTNVVRISGANNNNFVDKLMQYYDVVYAFDLEDAQKYGFKYSPLIYSENIIKDVTVFEQVFYVGRAKDRYNALIEAFQKIEALGVSQEMYIFGVKEEQQTHKDKITYNQMIPYYDVLKKIQGSTCLLDIIQGESTGYTIKVCEAVYYNKLLITTNEKIKEAPFYNKGFIKVIRDADDIEENFLKKWKEVKYTEEDRAFFSVETFLGKLKRDLDFR